MGASSVAGAAVLAGLGSAQGQERRERRDYYELRQYRVDTEDQVSGLQAYLRDAEIPALNRVDISPVGVFLPVEGISPIHVLRRSQSLESLAMATERLLGDDEYRKAAASFLDAPSEAPAYARIESALLVAFGGMPEMERPTDVPGRVLQLRIYESPSVTTGRKKIEMFDTAEIGIFRKAGLTPVFFGETLIGGKMPNLTYMLMFESREAQDAAWQRFLADPDWLELRARPEYPDKIVCGITNILLTPAEGSQV